MSALMLAAVNTANPAVGWNGWWWYWAVAAVLLFVIFFGYNNRHYQRPTTFGSSMPRDRITEGQWESLERQIQRLEERLDALEQRGKTG